MEDSQLTGAMWQRRARRRRRNWKREDGEGVGKAGEADNGSSTQARVLLRVCSGRYGTKARRALQHGRQTLREEREGLLGEPEIHSPGSGKVFVQRSNWWLDLKGFPLAPPPFATTPGDSGLS